MDSGNQVAKGARPSLDAICVELQDDFNRHEVNCEFLFSFVVESVSAQVTLLLLSASQDPRTHAISGKFGEEAGPISGGEFEARHPRHLEHDIDTATSSH